MISVTILLTCHNRREKTKRCIESIYDERYKIKYVVTDDGSTDGTAEMLQQMKKIYDITILQGDGTLFWCGGMRKSVDYVQEIKDKPDYIIFVNDDVLFFEYAVDKAIKYSKKVDNAVIAGATTDELGKLTYGGIRYEKHTIRYNTIDISDREKCDTFNCNFVLLPRDVFEMSGNFDSHYHHAMADFDYGLYITRLGYAIYTLDEYVGICEKNLKSDTWEDYTLSRVERIKRKEGWKGLPYHEWYYFLKKNFGWRAALWHSATPYLKILIGR